MLLDNVACFLLAKLGRRRKTISLFQMKELMRSFLNNSELTEDMKMGLSHRLGITQGQVVHFFKTQSKKPRSVSIIRHVQVYCAVRDLSALLNQYMH